MQQPRRRRFGVSLPESLAERLDMLAERLGANRSMLVERAVESFLAEHSHYLRSHMCRGVIILTGASLERIRGVYERYRDIVVSSSHHHVAGSCIELIVVEGHSSRIAGLHRELLEAGCHARFIPLHGPVDGDEKGGGAGSCPGAEA